MKQNLFDPDSIATVSDKFERVDAQRFILIKMHVAERLTHFEIRLGGLAVTMSLVLRPHHVVTLTGLSPNTLYSVSGMSVTADSQTVTSSELAFRSPR